MEDSTEPVENEDSPNAGHCVEPLKGMQPCAIAVGIPEARRVRKTVNLLAATLFFGIVWILQPIGDRLMVA